MNFKILVKSILRLMKDSEILEKYERKIALDETENHELENELEKLRTRFSEYQVEAQMEQKEKIDNYESLDQKLNMIISKIPLEIEGLSSKEIYEKYKRFDEEGWAVYRVCEELIEMNFYREYIIEDTLGWFELSDGNDLRYYRELYKFGTIKYKWINDGMTANDAEIIDRGKSKIDDTSKVYKKYEKELYLKALMKLKEAIARLDLNKRLSFVEQVITGNKIKEENDVNLENTYPNDAEEDGELEL